MCYHHKSQLLIKIKCFIGMELHVHPLIFKELLGVRTYFCTLTMVLYTHVPHNFWKTFREICLFLLQVRCHIFLPVFDNQCITFVIHVVYVLPKYPQIQLSWASQLTYLSSTPSRSIYATTLQNLILSHHTQINVIVKCILRTTSLDSSFSTLGRICPRVDSLATNLYP